MTRLFVALIAFLVLANIAPVRAQAEDGSGTAVEVHAYLLAFDRTSFTVTSGSLVTVSFFNDENYIPHNLVIDVPGVDAGKICIGPCVTSVKFTAPDPGSYRFYCTLHPDMAGTVFVQ